MTLRNHRWMHKGLNFFKNECKYDRSIRQRVVVAAAPMSLTF